MRQHKYQELAHTLLICKTQRYSTCAQLLTTLNTIDLFQAKLAVGITAPFLLLQEIKPGTAKSLAAFCDTELHIWIAVIFLYFFLPLEYCISEQWALDWQISLLDEGHSKNTFPQLTSNPNYKLNSSRLTQLHQTLHPVTKQAACPTYPLQDGICISLYQCMSRRNRWFPPVKFRPTPPASSETNITFKGQKRVKEPVYNQSQTSQLLTAGLRTTSVPWMHTWGPLGLLLNSSTTSILCLGLTEPSTVAYFSPRHCRCTATTLSMLVHWETTTLEREQGVHNQHSVLDRFGHCSVSPKGTQQFRHCSPLQTGAKPLPNSEIEV